MGPGDCPFDLQVATFAGWPVKKRRVPGVAPARLAMRDLVIVQAEVVGAKCRLRHGQRLAGSRIPNPCFARTFVRFLGFFSMKQQRRADQGGAKD